MVAERYYALVRQIIRKYDARTLILGDRYQPESLATFRKMQKEMKFVLRIRHQ